MHPALLIDEILRQIFMNLCRREASRVVVVCHVWKERALDVIWEDISDMRRIFGFLSERNMFDTEPSARWEKFKSYARRVKQLTFRAAFWKLTTDEMESWLDACPIEDQDIPLFPTLQKLDIQFSCMTSRLLALRCMSPSVRILSIHEFVKSTRGIELLLQTPRLCPNVVELDYDVRGFDRPPPYFNDVYLGLAHLQRLRISGFPLETVISTVSAHPTLVSLKWDGASYQMPECQGSFPCFENLDGLFDDAGPAIKLLSYLPLQSRKLKGVRFSLVQMDTEDSVPGMGLLGLTEAISQQPSLESLDLWFHLKPTSRPSCLFSHLEPLIHCQQLEKLRITTMERCWMGLSDTTFSGLMKSLLRLTHLVFTHPTPYQDQPPPLTLWCLANLAVSCRNLESIIISLDARQVPLQLECSSSVGAIAGSPHEHAFNPLPSLTSIGFGYSPVNEDGCLTLANYLKSLSACNLSMTLPGMLPSCLSRSTAKNPRVVWKRVATLLQGLYTAPQEGLQS